MIPCLLTLFALAGALLVPADAHAKVRVAASLNDLASIASTVGGEHIKVLSIVRPTANPHSVEVLPSYKARVSRAQIYLKVGLQLDKWADGMIDGLRKRRPTVVDCSRGLRVLEVPAGRVEVAKLDVHPNGNPHYWLDPRNGAVIARNIADALAQKDPAHGTEFRQRAETFAAEAEAAWKRGQDMARLVEPKVIFTYHRSWSYFVDAFGFEVAANAEPFPGFPPTARSLANMAVVAKSRNVQLLVQEPYSADYPAAFLARQAGVRAVVVSASCARSTPGSYLKHFSSIMRAMRQTTRKTDP